MKRTKYTGCDEDCVGCPYSDCRKPASRMKSDISTSVRRGEPETQSGAHMFTVEIGGRGSDTPNYSRKFYY